MSKLNRTPRFFKNQTVVIESKYIQGRHRAVILDISWQDGEPDYLLVPISEHVTFCSDLSKDSFRHSEHIGCKSCEGKYRTGWFLECEVRRD